MAETDTSIAPRSVSFVRAAPIKPADKWMILDRGDQWGGVLGDPVVNFDTEGLTLDKGSISSRGSPIEDEELVPVDIKDRKGVQVKQLKAEKSVGNGLLRIGDKTPTQYRDQLLKLMNEYRDIVVTSTNDLG